MAEDVLTQIIKRNDFYKQNFKRLTTVLLVSCILNIGLFVGLMFTIASKPQPNYFAVTENGRLLQLKGTQTAQITDSMVVSWVSQIVPKLYALDFLNYRSQLNDINKYFTSYGWTSYSTAFKAVLDQIVKDKLVTRATLQDVPVVTAKGAINGIMAWKVQVPVMINFQQGKKEQTNEFILSLTIMKNQNTESGELLGISQVVELPYSGK
ncbi:type IVB secretion system apparatus protein IcmL/DotI [Thiotrichales bacterium 19S3-7]|nr:type IVB secretion system apparatus protein IcmL/DotI [Thiotrichales bacterium 19S3-7]MCF6802662.1 type IVB secretion system apparatus protein IcmL/DotI [Thiotrichales bacterium 19S3-11]